MEIRPLAAGDIDLLSEIDATVESTQYLHLDRQGEGMSIQLKLEPRPLRAKLIEPFPFGDEQRFAAGQIASGADEGIALVAEHDRVPVALLVAQPRPALGTLKLIDLRVDYEHRRQGLATGMLFQAIQSARNTELRAVAVETRANNFPANQLLSKLDFELAGIDTRRHSNHDLVKETVTLFWYAALT